MVRLYHNNKERKELKMANKSKTALELWETRFGTSARIVKRSAKGQFEGNKSFKQLIKA